MLVDCGRARSQWARGFAVTARWGWNLAQLGCHSNELRGFNRSNLPLPQAIRALLIKLYTVIPHAESFMQQVVVWLSGWLADITSMKTLGHQTHWNYGTFAPKNFRSREQKYHVMELSLPGTFTPGSESSKNFRSLELSLPGTFAPGSENSKNFRSHAKWLSVVTFIHGYVGLR